MGAHMPYDPMNSIARVAQYLGAVTADATVAGAAGTSVLGYEDVVLCAHVATVSNGADDTFTINLHDATTLGGTYALITGATKTVTDDDDNRLVRIRVRASKTRGFVKASATAANGATVDFVCMWIEKHGLVDSRLGDGSPDSTYSGQAATKFDVAV